jgi:hypothetical protein
VKKPSVVALLAYSSTTPSATQLPNTLAIGLFSRSAIEMLAGRARTQSRRWRASSTTLRRMTSWAQAMLGGQKEGDVRPLADFSTPASKRAVDDASEVTNPKRPRLVASRTVVHDPPPIFGGDPFLDVSSNGDTSSAMMRTGLTVNTQVLREVRHACTNALGEALVEIYLSLASVRYEVQPAAHPLP